MVLSTLAQQATFSGTVRNANDRNLRVEGSVLTEIQKENQAQFNTELHAQQASQNSENLKNIFSNYKRTAEKNEIAYTILRGNDLLIKSSLLCFSNNVKIPILCDVADAALGKIEDGFKEQMNHNSSVILKTSLDKVITEEGIQTYNTIIANRDPNQFIRDLQSHTGIMSALYNSMTDVKPGDKDVVLSAMIKASDEAIKNNFVNVNKQATATKDGLDTANRNLTSLSRAFQRFALNTDSRLSKIVTLESEAVNLNIYNIGLSQDIDNKVNLLEDFAYARMTPEEKLRTLNSGILNEKIPPGKRDSLKKQLNADIKTKELNSTIGDYLNGANELVGIAEKLGLNPAIVQSFQTGVNIGSTAFTAFKDIEATDFIGAAGALASLFGAIAFD